jgi:DNA replication protein DnaC
MTHLAIALEGKAAEYAFSLAIFRLEELLTNLGRDASVGPLRLRRREYANVALLIVGKVKFELIIRHDASLFFRMVSWRYSRSSILVTTNKGIKTGRNSPLATATLDRLLHKC